MNYYSTVAFLSKLNPMHCFELVSPMELNPMHYFELVFLMELNPKHYFKSVSLSEPNPTHFSELVVFTEVLHSTRYPAEVLPRPGTLPTPHLVDLRSMAHPRHLHLSLLV